MSDSPAAGRLDGPDWGLLIDRSRPVAFTFDGRFVDGYAGDTIASALMADGRSVLSRSFKYHRPRGALTMAGQDVNAMVQVGAEPNVRGDRHRIAEGMAVTSINRAGSLDRDLYAGLELFSRFLPVGFYYKTFFRPNGAWKLYERPIRELAGLGTLDPKAHHAYHDKQYLFTDVLVVGGGRAGLEAAIAHARAGEEVLLVEEWPRLGGSLLFGRLDGSRKAAVARLEALIAEAQAEPTLTILTDTTVTGLFSDHWASAVRGNRLYKIRAKATIVAAGSFEQPLVFRNNDRPGILFADAVQRLMRLYGVRPGTTAVVATANAAGYEAALDLLEAGVAVAAIVDLTDGVAGPAAEAAAAQGVRILKNATLVDARGKARVEAVAVDRITGRGTTAGRPDWIACDLVPVSVGVTPALNLASHAGARVVYDEAIAMHRAVGLPPGLSLAGAAASEGLDGVNHPWPIFSSPKAKDFVDFDEDLQVKDIVNSVKDGYDDIQLVKRYSTVGLGPSQGRHANLNTIRIVAAATGKTAEAVGTTTFRPPLVPETFAHLAGRAFEPVRLTAMHQRHLESDARMMVAGLWMRPAYYGARQDAEASIEAEVRAVRTNVGLIDVSTLGGLDIRGPDAADFVDRIYTWAYAKQPVGRARYALATDQAGVVIDDGVACRFHERHYYVTATTSGVDALYRQMLWWNAQWRLDVDIANVTAAYAAVNLAGPNARRVLEGIETDIDLSPGAFPYMAVRQGSLAGIPVRVLRVGFVGELGYEIHAPSSRGAALWDLLMGAGRAHGIRPFGVEAQRVMRLEKGHIIVGQDTDGLTNPAEANMEWALAKKKPFYVGKRAIEMQMTKGVARRLVGFTLVDGSAPAPKECHLVIRGGAIAGRVTSAVLSPSLGKVVGLAYVPADLAAPGSRFEIRIEKGRTIEAEVVPTPFYDPDNKRQEL